MMNEKTDIEILKNIMQSFLKKRSIQQKLKYVCTEDITGWEKWFQLELQHFISVMLKVKVYKEVPAIPDKRSLKKKNKLYVDLAFKLDPDDDASYMFLELKCAKRVPTLIDAFERDIHKISSIRSCDFFHQSIFCLGFHLNCTRESVKQIKDHIKLRKLGYHQVIRFCRCRKDIDCNCTDNRIGFAII